MGLFNTFEARDAKLDMAFCSIDFDRLRHCNCRPLGRLKEEVALHDGRAILVERSLYFEFKLICGDAGTWKCFTTASDVTRP